MLKEHSHSSHKERGKPASTSPRERNGRDGVEIGEDLQSLTSATPEQIHVAFAAFDELSLTFLKPVYDKPDGSLNYDELKIMRMLC